MVVDSFFLLFKWKYNAFLDGLVLASGKIWAIPDEVIEIRCFSGECSTWASWDCGVIRERNIILLTVFLAASVFQIIAAQEEMLKKERELEEARKKLAQIRQQQYKFLPTELREDEG